MQTTPNSTFSADPMTHNLPRNNAFLYTFKLCLTVFKALQGMTHSYTAELCGPVVATLNLSRLRSATCGDLVVPRNRLELGKRAFDVAGPPREIMHRYLLELHIPYQHSRQLFKRNYSMLLMVHRNIND